VCLSLVRKLEKKQQNGDCKRLISSLEESIEKYYRPQRKLMDIQHENGKFVRYINGYKLNE